MQLTTLFTDIRTLVPMLRAVVKGRYPMPWKTFFWVLLCGVYFLSPIDVLPDVVPLLGFADDGAFAVFVLLLVHRDLEKFRQHTQDQENIIEAEIIENKEPKK